MLILFNSHNSPIRCSLHYPHLTTKKFESHNLLKVTQRVSGGSEIWARTGLTLDSPLLARFHTALWYAVFRKSPASRTASSTTLRPGKKSRHLWPIPGSVLTLPHRVRSLLCKGDMLPKAHVLSSKDAWSTWSSNCLPKRLCAHFQGTRLSPGSVLLSKVHGVRVPASCCAQVLAMCKLGCP